MRRLALGVAATAFSAVLTAVGGGVAHAGQVVDFNYLYTGYVDYGDTEAYIWPVVDGSHKASYAEVDYGSYGASARAECERDNGGVNWYESTIHVYAGGGQSHFDCDNNGTYNHAIVGNGVDLF